MQSAILIEIAGCPGDQPNHVVWEDTVSSDNIGLPVVGTIGGISAGKHGKRLNRGHRNLCNSGQFGNPLIE